MTDGASMTTPASGRWAWRGRLADFVDANLFVLLILIAGALVQVSFLRFELGTDSWYSLVGGRVVNQSWLPHHNTLTLIGHGRAWVDQQWLAHLLLYGLWAAGGWPLALLCIAAFSVFGFAIAAVTARRVGATARSTALVLLACFIVGFTNTSFQAQTIAYVLFALVGFLLVTDELNPSRRVFLVLPLLALWANIHGSVVLAAALVTLRGLTVAVAGLRSGLRPSTWLPRASALAVVPWLCTIASPYGFDLPSYYRRILDNPTLARLIMQWQPPTIRSQPQFFVVLFAACWLAFRQRNGLGLFARLGLLATAIGGLSALRHMVWFSLFATAVLPRALDQAWPPTETARHRRLNLAIAGAALVVLVAAAVTTASHGRAWFENRYPRRGGDAVASAAARDPRLSVYADGRYADWLLFEHPALVGRVAYDVRYELLTESELQQIHDFSTQQGNGWTRVALGYRLFVLDADREREIIRFYLVHRHATTRYRDERIVVLELPST
jgi:hypothetical protein